jgi:hypothetical protein
MVWTRDYVYNVLEAACVSTFSFFLAEQQGPAMFNRLTCVFVALSCLVPEY